MMFACVGQWILPSAYLHALKSLVTMFSHLRLRLPIDLFPMTFPRSNLRCIGSVVLSDSIKFDMLHSQHIRFLNQVILTL